MSKKYDKEQRNKRNGNPHRIKRRLRAAEKMLTAYDYNPIDEDKKNMKKYG